MFLDVLSFPLDEKELEDSLRQDYENWTRMIAAKRFQGGFHRSTTSNFFYGCDFSNTRRNLTSESLVFSERSEKQRKNVYVSRYINAMKLLKNLSKNIH